MIFVDTGGWFALVVPTDPNHARASKFLDLNDEPLFTTDYVVDETLTLLRARGEMSRALALGESLFQETVSSVYRLSDYDIQRAWEIFKTFHDKEWSFTDCTSKGVIEEFGITKALAFDRHFQQFGVIEQLP